MVHDIDALRAVTALEAGSDDDVLPVDRGFLRQVASEILEARRLAAFGIGRRKPVLTYKAPEILRT